MEREIMIMNKKKEIHIGLTGHRPKDLWGYNLNDYRWQEVKSMLMGVIEEAIDRYELVVCHSGMAIGADTIWAMAIVEVKNKFPNNVKFVAEIPFIGHIRGDSNIKTWNQLLESADEQVIYQEEFSGWSYEQRNRGMVDSSDIMIAIWRGNMPEKGSGTWNATRYTMKKDDKKLFQLHPNYRDKFNLIRTIDDVIQEEVK